MPDAIPREGERDESDLNEERGELNLFMGL